MKPSLVLGVSTVAKWFVKGMSPGRCWIRDLYLRGAVTIYVSSLLFTELANALKRSIDPRHPSMPAVCSMVLEHH